MARGKSKNLGPWFRMYASILDSPKISRISDALFRSWVSMMALATIYGGMIPLDLSDVAFRLRRPIAKVRAIVDALLAAHLMDKTEGGYLIHDWEEKQFDSDVSTGRVKQFRERQRNGPETVNETPMKRFNPVSETPNETSPDTDTDSEQKQKLSNQSPSLDAAREQSPSSELPPEVPAQGPIPPIGTAEEATAWAEFQRKSVVTLAGRRTHA